MSCGPNDTTSPVSAGMVTTLYDDEVGHPPLVGEIIRTLVGSTLHGTGIDGVEDRDEMGVIIEEPRYLLGLDNFEQYQYRTAEARRAWNAGTPKQPRSEAGDLDLVVYSAKKYLHLASSGNPSMLLLLFVPEHLLVLQTPKGRSLQELAPAIVSKQAGPRFLGYMQSQRERLMGIRGGRHTNRPELEAIHGYDTKYAMHMVRLGFQGVELLVTGRITLPMEGTQAELCRAIRRGEVPYDEVLTTAGALEAAMRVCMASSDLRDKPDRAVINEWLVNAYQTQWLGSGGGPGTPPAPQREP